MFRGLFRFEGSVFAIIRVPTKGGSGITALPSRLTSNRLLPP